MPLLIKLRLNSLFSLHLPFLLVLLLSACGGGSGIGKHMSSDIGRGMSALKTVTFSAVGSYKTALHYYESGDIMLARSAAIRTDAKRPDYPDAQKLLKEKIEPARLQLLRHYRRMAEKEEQRGALYRAKEFYLKTATVWIGDDSMLQQAARIDLILRQKRIDQLSEQRRKEDAQLLDALNRYSPPRGLDPKDQPMAREEERIQDLVLTRGRNAWRAAKRELHEGHPEIAYVEAESYLRLRPGSHNGPLLMREVKEALPKGLRIPQESRQQRSKASASPQQVTADQINQLMQQDKWIQAYSYALIYRREGGDEADALLQSINKTLKKQAEVAFRAGQMAFQSEQLDKAVEEWGKAAELQPDNRDYTDSLRRAQELQERFRILQSNG
ncbi:MAG: hypothetical protein COY36_03195 [Zetaproteobacteria bacterium CG_4_10_14_0_2_um_filter_55_20]|nr:MAG: hypothetical protein AUJ58_11500 [Zetaproteobacteria bacterium CG1_02_55_237]PIS18561.1 MAG: hypothetical protein COT53_10245 [Zetaproteobacteria bacterium CG08_land_8_20_14_0_20_55_17]PIY53943.1 MAG: hypothetical protein COZ01_02160 [Zetaproteobacteria bacterium CG_4_10_14_0_8_um_filter_55_43]PIZ39388.1 MAG: hypothetical protein COY36_03195 [Zetaproteobacteria bacterium CG_4_10_14_0_2_um_filter_55_20]PJB80744.1 MAG: hypothetical protein CO089_06555 [Zetaproteobacteria bacterium CG_4_9_